MNIINAYNNLKQLCAEFTIVDSSLTVNEVDQLIDILISLQKLPYQEIKSLRRKIRYDYSQLFSPEEQCKMHMKWALPHTSYDDFREIIINNLYDENIYENIMLSIENDKLHFAITEMLNIPKNFIEYCIMNFENCKEEYNEDITPKCTNAELFLVNCLSVYENKTNILATIGRVSLPYLRVMPVKYIVFEGDDLLNQIYSYYKTRELSPLLGAKRNIVVLEGNEKSEAYDYAEFKYVYSTKYCALTIEFPYLCYVYPETVSLNIEDDINIELKAYVGIDVVQIKKTKPYLKSVCRNVKTHSCKISSKTPCTYIGFSLGFSTFAMVGCPQVSGRAVILV